MLSIVSCYEYITAPKKYLFSVPLLRSSIELPQTVGRVLHSAIPGFDLRSAFCVLRFSYGVLRNAFCVPRHL